MTFSDYSVHPMGVDCQGLTGQCELIQKVWDRSLWGFGLGPRSLGEDSPGHLFHFQMPNTAKESIRLFLASGFSIFARSGQLWSYIQGAVRDCPCGDVFRVQKGRDLDQKSLTDLLRELRWGLRALK
jgi:hypothetical protein